MKIEYWDPKNGLAWHAMLCILWNLNACFGWPV